MHKMKSAIFALAATISLPAHASELGTCKDHPSLSGLCFEVSGRLSVYAGNPSLRLWPIDTNRLLGVSESKFKVEGISNIPSNLAEIEFNSSTKVYGTFNVCPFTEQKPGEMQLICIDSATINRAQSAND